MSASNENAPAWDRRARKDIPAASNARPVATGKPKEKIGKTGAMPLPVSKIEQDRSLAR